MNKWNNAKGNRKEYKLNKSKSSGHKLPYHLAAGKSVLIYLFFAPPPSRSLPASPHNKITYNNIVSICICLQCRAALQVSVVVAVDGIVAAKAACFLCMLSQQEWEDEEKKHVKKKHQHAEEGKKYADPKCLKEWLPMCNVHALRSVHLESPSLSLSLSLSLLIRPTGQQQNWKETKRNENKIKSNLRKCKQKPKLSRNVLQLHSCVQCDDDFLCVSVCMLHACRETGNKRLRDDQSNFSLVHLRLRNTF